MMEPLGPVAMALGIVVIFSCIFSALDEIVSLLKVLVARGEAPKEPK